MKKTHSHNNISRIFWIFLFVSVCLCGSKIVLAADSAWEKFVPPPDDKFDWIQLTSGEWLKGKLKFLYDYKVEFDSEELNLLTFDLEDVKQIRTHKPQSISVQNSALSDAPIIVEGGLYLVDNKVIMTTNDGKRVFERNQLISIAQTKTKEKDLWSGNISLGANFRDGNTETVDVNLKVDAKRYTATSRLVLNYLGNYSEANKEETSNNHRLSGYRDAFLSKELFWRQISGEYYRDKFKNIDHQLSLSTAIGYNFIYTPKTKWEIFAGLGARYTNFISVEEEKNKNDTSPAFGAGTVYDTEVTKWMDFLLDYSFQIVNEDAGRYTHHFISTLSTDLINDLDFDFTFVWDRIQEPQPDSGGSIPEKNDYQLIFGLSYDI